MKKIYFLSLTLIFTAFSLEKSCLNSMVDLTLDDYKFAEKADLKIAEIIDKIEKDPSKKIYKKDYSKLNPKASYFALKQLHKNLNLGKVIQVVEKNHTLIELKAEGWLGLDQSEPSSFYDLNLGNGLRIEDLTEAEVNEISSSYEGDTTIANKRHAFVGNFYLNPNLTPSQIDEIQNKENSFQRDSLNFRLTEITLSPEQEKLLLKNQFPTKEEFYRIFDRGFRNLPSKTESTNHNTLPQENTPTQINNPSNSSNLPNITNPLNTTNPHKPNNRSKNNTVKIIARIGAISISAYLVYKIYKWFKNRQNQKNEPESSHTQSSEETGQFEYKNYEDNEDIEECGEEVE